MAEDGVRKIEQAIKSMREEARRARREGDQELADDMDDKVNELLEIHKRATKP